jgi:serine/threonine protein kinase
MQTGRLDPVAKYAIAKKLIGLVDDLHGLGIMHGDLKPQNILLVSQGVAAFDLCLCDLDSARRIGPGPAQLFPQDAQGRLVRSPSLLQRAGLRRIEAEPPPWGVSVDLGSATPCCFR